MSTVRLLVLGSIFRKGFSYGYAVYSDITSWHADSWTSVKPGSIYHALDKLESLEMIKSIKSDDSEKIGPSRKEYIITQQGESEFVNLLESALVSFDFQEFSVGVAFMDTIPRKKVIELLQQRRAELEKSINFLEGLPTEEFPPDPSKHPELVGIWVGYVKNEAVTTENIFRNLQAGKYRFNSKKWRKNDETD